MDYLGLLRKLKAEFKETNRQRYESMNIVLKIVLTLVFIPLRVGFFFGKLMFWFTWFFFKALAAPVDFLCAWFEKQKESMGDISKAILVLVCMPFIFCQQILLAFNSFSFFFQWFGLMLSAYIMTLGKIRWQPVITEAKFDEE